MTRIVPAIEAESYAILRSAVDTTGLPRLTRAVVERVVHASADIGYVDDLVCSEDDLLAGQAALHGGAPVVTDIGMVAAGISKAYLRSEPVCRLGDPRTAEIAKREDITRSAAAVRLAFAEVGPGAVWVVGCAPTALFELIALDVRPALVVGLPVGFVGAAESKAALRDSGLPSISNRAAKGGSAIAVAAVNALLYTPAEEGS